MRCSNWQPHSVRDPAPIIADLLRAVPGRVIHSEVVRLHPDETYVLSQLAEEISHSLRSSARRRVTLCGRRRSDARRDGRPL